MQRENQLKLSIIFRLSDRKTQTLIHQRSKFNLETAIKIPQMQSIGPE